MRIMMKRECTELRCSEMSIAIKWSVWGRSLFYREFESLSLCLSFLLSFLFFPMREKLLSFFVGSCLHSMSVVSQIPFHRWSKREDFDHQRRAESDTHEWTGEGWEGVTEKAIESTQGTKKRTRNKTEKQVTLEERNTWDGESRKSYSQSESCDCKNTAWCTAYNQKKDSFHPKSWWNDRDERKDSQ